MAREARVGIEGSSLVKRGVAEHIGKIKICSQVHEQLKKDRKSAFVAHRELQRFDSLERRPDYLPEQPHASQSSLQCWPSPERRRLSRKISRRSAVRVEEEEEGTEGGTERTAVVVDRSHPDGTARVEANDPMGRSESFGWEGSEEVKDGVVFRVLRRERDEVREGGKEGKGELRPSSFERLLRPQYLPFLPV